MQPRRPIPLVGLNLRRGSRSSAADIAAGEPPAPPDPPSSSLQSEPAGSGELSSQARGGVPRGRPSASRAYAGPAGASAEVSRSDAGVQQAVAAADQANREAASSSAVAGAEAEAPEGGQPGWPLWAGAGRNVLEAAQEVAQRLRGRRGESEGGEGAGLGSGSGPPADPGGVVTPHPVDDGDVSPDPVPDPNPATLDQLDLDRAFAELDVVLGGGSWLGSGAGSEAQATLLNPRNAHPAGVAGGGHGEGAGDAAGDSESPDQLEGFGTAANPRSNASRQQGDAAGGAADPRAEAALRPEGTAGGAPNSDGARQPGSGGAAEGARPKQAAREPDLGNKAAKEELDESQQASPFEPDLREQVAHEAPVLTEQAARERTLVARVSSDASFVSATGSLASAMSDGPRSADKRSYLKSADPAAAGLEGGPVATPRDPEFRSSNSRAERGSAPTNGRAEPPGVPLGDPGLVSGGPGAQEGRSSSPFAQAVRGLGGDTTCRGAGVGPSAEPGPAFEPLSGLGSGRVSAELPVSHHAAAPALSLASPADLPLHGRDDPDQNPDIPYSARGVSALGSEPATAAAGNGEGGAACSTDERTAPAQLGTDVGDTGRARSRARASDAAEAAPAAGPGKRHADVTCSERPQSRAPMHGSPRRDTTGAGEVGDPANRLEHGGEGGPCSNPSALLESAPGKFAAAGNGRTAAPGNAQPAARDAVPDLGFGGLKFVTAPERDAGGSKVSGQEGSAAASTTGTAGGGGGGESDLDVALGDADDGSSLVAASEAASLHGDSDGGALSTRQRAVTMSTAAVSLSSQ